MDLILYICSVILEVFHLSMFGFLLLFLFELSILFVEIVD